MKARMEFEQDEENPVIVEYDAASTKASAGDD